MNNTMLCHVIRNDPLQHDPEKPEKKKELISG